MSTPSQAQTKSRTVRGLKLTAEDRQVLDRTFSIDTRALAVVRIAFALLLLIESLFLDWSRYGHANPAIDFLYRNSNLLIVPFAVMMLVGYKTRLATLLCWALYSIPQRSDLLAGEAIDMGDFITAVLLLWMAFLPLGRQLSIDSRGRASAPTRYLSVASGGLLFQIFVVYFSAGLLKSLREWVIDATALQNVLSNPLYETALGTALLDHPSVLAVMSVATYVIEVVGALLVLVPGKSLEKRRLVIVPLFIALHLGIAALMGIGLFPYVMIAAWLLFLPARAWDRLWVRFGGQHAEAQPEIDRNGVRSVVAGVLVGIMLLSNVLSWLYFPNFEGFSDGFQDFTVYLVMYQRWAMFVSPSTLPV